MESPADPNECKCECRGRLHGSQAPELAPPKATPHRRPSRNVRRAAAITGTVTALATIGGITFEATAGGATGGTSLTVQVRLEVTDAVKALEALGFAGVVAPTPAPSTNCAASATGAVSQFLGRHPCKEYTSTRFTVHRQGAAARIVISWVMMPTTSLASRYKATADTPSTGNPPGGQGFNGHCYASGQNGAKVWTEQVRPIGQLAVTTERQLLQAAAPAKLSTSYRRRHCDG
jgi:hypothetical protein